MNSVAAAPPEIAAPHPLCGRAGELERIDALLAGAREGHSGALVLRGVAGAGKTALLEAAQATAVDMCVLASGGVESEAELPYAALHQLLRPVLGRLDELPEVQAQALRGALGSPPAAASGAFSSRWPSRRTCAARSKLPPRPKPTARPS